MKKETKIGASLTLIGHSIDHEEVSRYLSVQPNYQRYRGEVVGKSNYIFDHDEWGISTERIESVEVSECLSMLIDRMSSKVSDMVFLAQRYSAEWHILVEVDIYKQRLPIIIFDQTIIDFIYKIKGQLGFDMLNH